MARAIDLLPAELKPFFEHYRDEAGRCASSIPTLWRIVGWEDDPNHFVDFGVTELGEYPFTALPREYGAALEKFGMATLDRNGLLPWREAEEFGNLRRAFEGFTRELAVRAERHRPVRGGRRRTTFRTRTSRFMPRNNYDGQLTGNTGIHARFETRAVRAVPVTA